MSIEKGKEMGSWVAPEPKNNFNPKTGLYKYRMVYGRSWAKRCQRIKKRDGIQCNNVAKEDSRSQKCGFHGGGARPDLLGNKFKVTHGKTTLAKLKEERDKRTKIAYLEDVLRILFTPDKPPRNLPNSPFRPFRTVEKAKEYLKSIGYDESQY